MSASIILFMATFAASPPLNAESTPAERAISRARRSISDDGGTVEEYVALASALSRRARETADPAWYDRSDDVLELAEERFPGGFIVERQRIWNALGKHEFGAAYVAAKRLNGRAKDDVATYGLLVDACVELGKYEEAEEAAQWMLNLRQGSPSAMTRVSYLRELFGDLPGAIEAMRMAFHSTRASESEDRAWILTHLAHLELERGKVDAAATYVDSALTCFPDYHYALQQRAKVQTFRGEHVRAIATLERRYEVAPHPENLFDVGLAMLRAGDEVGAADRFRSFESAALEEAGNLDNANLSLIEYWLDVEPNDERIAKALALAEARVATRQDISTLEALAWAQHRSGDSTEAWNTIRRALSIGIVNSRLRHRAGVIAEAAGESELAKTQHETAWRTAPGSEFGDRSREVLLRMDRAK